MLRIEKNRQTKDLEVTLRSKSSRPDTPFWIAFGSALAIHLVFLLCVRIAPIQFGWENFPPVTASVDIEVPEGQQAQIDLEEEELPVRYAHAPDEELPLPPLIAQARLDPIYPWLKADLMPLPFSPYQPPLSDAEVNRRRGDEVNLTFYGPVAELKRKTQPEDKWHIPASKTMKGDYYAILKIKVDTQTGEIFWHEFAETAGPKILNAHALDLLAHAKFHPLSAEQPILCGWAECTFRLGVE